MSSENVVMTPYCRLSFPHLFEPRAASDEPGAKVQYSCALLFDDDTDVTAMKKAVLFAAKSKFGERAKQVLAGPRGNPFRQQAEKSSTEGYGKKGLFVTCRSNTKPGVCDRNVVDILDASQVYAGLIVRAKLRAYAWEHKTGKGVSFGLLNIQVVRDDGTRWDGRSTPQDDFQPIEVDTDEEAAGDTEKGLATAGGEDDESWF